MSAMERWGLELADGWQAELEEGTVCIAHPEGEGALLVSPTEKQAGTVARDELLELAHGECPGDADVGDCELGDFRGVHATYRSDGVRWHRWYLSHGSLLLFVTYAVGAADEGGDEGEEVVAMLRTLRARGDRWE